MKKRRKPELHLILQQKALEQVDMALSLAMALDGEKADTIHDIRVATKRLRTYWRILRPIVEDDIFQIHNRSLSEAATSLSQSRENHVSRKLIQKYLKKEPSKEMSLVLQRLLELIPEDEQIANANTRTIKHALYREQDYWQLKYPLQKNNSASTEKGLESIRRKEQGLAKKAIKHDLEPLLAHQWRKWAKYLYYSMEIAAEIKRDKKSRKKYEGLEGLNNLLGKSHDLFILQTSISNLQKQGVLEQDLSELSLFLESKYQKMSQRIIEKHNYLNELQ